MIIITSSLTYHTIYDFVFIFIACLVSYRRNKLTVRSCWSPYYKSNSAYFQLFLVYGTIITCHMIWSVSRPLPLRNHSTNLFTTFGNTCDISSLVLAICMYGARQAIPMRYRLFHAQTHSVFRIHQLNHTCINRANIFRKKLHISRVKWIPIWNNTRKNSYNNNCNNDYVNNMKSVSVWSHLSRVDSVYWHYPWAYITDIHTYTWILFVYKYAYKNCTNLVLQKQNW